MDEATRRYWEAIADQVIDRAVEAAMDELAEKPHNSSTQLCRQGWWRAGGEGLRSTDEQ